MGHAVDDFCGGEFLDDCEVAAVGAHEGCTGLVLELVDVLVGAVFCYLEEELAGEGVAVGVETVGGQSEEDVADLDVFTGDDLVAVDGTDDGSGEVVFSVGVEAGHLCGFAADEGAAVGAAGFADALDDLLDDHVFESAGGEVVEEEERGGPLDGDVVDAVVDEILADGVMDIEVECDLELGADAVGGGDEDGVGKLLQVEGEETAEAADFAEDLFIEGLAGEHLDALFAAVAGGDVYTGVGVADGLLLLGSGGFGCGLGGCGGIGRGKGFVRQSDAPSLRACLVRHGKH